MTDFDPYAALGVGRKATPDAIKRAYRAQARKTHPDRQGGDASKMADVNRAYALLSDDGARNRYDQSGDIRPPPTREFSANELVSQVCAAWLQQDVPQGAVAPDLLPFAQSSLAQHIRQIGNELGKRRRGLAKMERELKRLTRKGTRVGDPIRGMFDQARGKYEEQVTQLSESEAVAKLALEIVNEYGVTMPDSPQRLYISGWTSVT